MQTGWVVAGGQEGSGKTFVGREWFVVSVTEMCRDEDARERSRASGGTAVGVGLYSVNMERKG